MDVSVGKGIHLEQAFDSVKFRLLQVMTPISLLFKHDNFNLLGSGCAMFSGMAVIVEL